MTSVKDVGFHGGTPGPHTGILTTHPVSSQPLPLEEMKMGLAGLNPLLPFHLNSLWASNKTLDRVQAKTKKEPLPEFYVQFNRMKRSLEVGGMDQGLASLVGNPQR